MNTGNVNGGPAFARPRSVDNSERFSKAIPEQTGMSLRDYFAAHALTALAGHKAITSHGVPWLAEHAYLIADAMLKARETK